MVRRGYSNKLSRSPTTGVGIAGILDGCETGSEQEWDQYHRSRCRRPTPALPVARSTAIVAGLLRRISWVNASTYSSAALAAAELTELFEVFSSINEAWKGLDKRGVSTVLDNTVDTGSKRVFTWGSSSRNHAPNDCHSLANRSFSGSRSARWRCRAPRAAGRPRLPWLGQWSRVDNRRALGTFEALVSNRALPLRS